MRFVRTAENLFGLPQGFQRVEYLESSGTQYIDTGVLPVNNMEFECKFTFTSLVSTNLTIVGSRDGEKRCQPIGAYNNKWSASIGGSYDANGTSVSANTPYIIKSTITNGQTITTNVNGSQASTCTSTIGLPSQELYIFARNFYGNTDPADSKVNGKLNYLRIKANGVLVRDFIPCIDPLGVPCMYDLVGKKPYYNQGTGTFTAGRKIIPVEYIESSGTQWLKTDCTLTANTKIDVLFSPNQQATANLWVIGSYVASNKLTGVRITGETTLDFYINTVVSKTVSGSNIGNRYQAVLDGKWTVNGSEGTAVTVSAGLSPLTLFGWNASNTANTYNISGLCKTKVYHCKIWDNGVLVRDYIPCIDENNVGFMFDKVSGTCYLNAGTGAFSVGENKYTSKLRLIKDAVLLPDGYKRVEYLESTGTQYINTGVYPTQLTEAEYRCAVTGSVANNDSHLFGSRLSASSEAFDLAYMNTSANGLEKFRFIHGTTTTQEATTSVTASQLANPHTYYMSGTSFKVDGSEKMSFTTSSFTGTYSLWLFGVNSAGSLHNQVRAQRVYKCKIWNNGTLVRDFIPVLDNAGIPAFYDQVNGGTYYNQGTGSFTYGHTITPVEYLESTGTQYINTGYIPTNTTGVQVRHTICADNGTDNILFGCRQTGGNNRFWEDIDWGGADNIGWGFNEYSNNVSGYRCPLTSDMIGQTIISSFNFMNDRACKVNGVSYDPSIATKTLATITRPIYLFAANNQGNAGYFNACKIFSCQISEGSTLVRSFIPVRDENNVGYMFDEVTGQMFGNAGSGSFGLGNDLPTAKVRFIQDVLPREYRPLKYLESSGTQYILTGFTPTVNTDFELELSSTKTSTNWAMGCPTWVGVHYKGADGQIGVTNSSTSDFQRYVNYARDNTKITMKLQGDTVYADGVSLGTITRRAGTLDFALFGYRDANRGATLFFTGSIYKCTMWDNGVPVRDLYPALRKSDNKPGMYDRITKQFFVNQGTGEFNFD